jgi:hypothetical protein
MRAIIGLNSAVAMAPAELHWWTRLLSSHRRTTGDRAWPAFLERFVDWPPTQRLGLDRTELLERLRRVPAGDHSGVFGATMRAFAAHLGKPRWGEKTPQLELYSGEIREAFPGASFVYMVRDPRDVVASTFRFRARPPRRRVARDVTWVALNWRESIRLALREGANDPDRFLVVSYERLVDRPRETIEGICQKLGLEFEPAMLDPERFRGFAAFQATSLSGPHQGIDRVALGTHRSRLAPRKRWICERLLQREMRQLGYEPEQGRLGIVEAALLPVELAGAAGDASLRRLDRIARGAPR